MDDRWETEVVEYGAINITGFRIVDSFKQNVKDFLEGKLDCFLLCKDLFDKYVLKS